MGDWVERVRSLLEAPSAAVLTTYRKDGTALVSPVWFRGAEGAFEIVNAEGDVKLRHLTREPRCVLVVFELVRPFRGVEVRPVAELVECDVTPIRAAIAARYLGASDGERFVAQRRSTPGVLLRLVVRRATRLRLVGDPASLTEPRSPREHATTSAGTGRSTVRPKYQPRRGRFSGP